MAFITPTPLTLSAASPFRSTAPLKPSPQPRILRKPSATRMIIVEPTTNPVTTLPPKTLSSRAIDLLSYVRGHKSIFRAGVGFNSTQATLFRKNDTGRSLTPLDELATNAHVLPGGSVAAMILVREEELVECALRKGKEVMGGVVEGKLEEIMEFDFRYMLRVISYACASASLDFMHVNNWNILKALHEEVGISGNVDAEGLKAMKTLLLAQLEEGEVVEKTKQCFDKVIQFMA